MLVNNLNKIKKQKHAPSEDLTYKAMLKRKKKKSSCEIKALIWKKLARGNNIWPNFKNKDWR